MPELSWRFGRNRVLIDLLVLKAAYPSDMASAPARALLDTGATVSGIGPRIIDELGLESYGKKRLKSATDEAFVDYYLFRLGFDVRSGRAEEEAIPHLPFVFEELDGFSWGRSADFDVILGMDVIGACDLTMTRDGCCSLAFGLG